ncbi:Tetratricopeptide repeat protein 28 [Chamberlinius hualienensis]
MESVDGGSEDSMTSSKTLFLEKVRLSNIACQNGDFDRAVQLYTDAIALDAANHILYSNRSAAYIKLGRYDRALQDAIKARELHPKWAKAYYRQGVALLCLERQPEAIAAFASGLAQEPKNLQLLSGLVESAMKSPLKSALEPTYRQLQSMHLDKSPFVIMSVIGQELLATGHFQSAVVVLEAALQIGTCSLKLRGSVFSALSSAYWALNSLDKAIGYMQQDLAITKSLGDTAGECRAHGNLGSAYFSKGNFKEALTSHRYQLVLAMKCKDSQAAASALTSLGHVYTAIGDYPNALASHKQCVQLVKQRGDRLQEAREIGNVGAVYLAMGDFESAVDCHSEHLRLAKQLGNKVEEARAYSNLGSSHHFKRSFEKAITYHERVLHIAKELGDKGIEARAYAGLGHAARCLGDYSQAKHWHERQLDVALVTKDQVGEGRACSNLGIVYQLLGDHDAALKLHQSHLNIARSLQDRAGMGRAYGNIGNAYSAMRLYDQAIKYHKQELIISKEVNDRSSEAATHGNLAVAYQALGMYEMALFHYHSHLNVARELKDTNSEACALLNMANCYSSCNEFAQAVPYYENYLMLSQELHDVEGEAKACHFLGYAHYCLGNYKEAIRYYNQDLALAKDLQDTTSIGRAHCNLGLAHLALGQYPESLECQKYFLAIAHMMKHVQGKFRALGNIGDVLMKMKNADEAARVYHKQLLLAKQHRDKSLEACAHGALGLMYRTLKCYDKALGYHTQELTLKQEICDIKGECKTHSHLGAVHMALGNYTNAIKCYEEQVERAKELKDLAMESQAFGNLGIARLNMGHFEDAIGHFEQQLATLEQVPGSLATLEKGRAYGSLGECYDALGDFEEAVKSHEKYLTIALSTSSLKDQDRAYQGLGNSHRCLGNLQQALVCFEKRLVVTHELNNSAAKSSAYSELGQVHSLLGNYEQAISCLEHQLTICRSSKDRAGEADAVCGLGTVYQQMGEYQMALRYHLMDLAIAEETGQMATQGRAFGNLGVAHECLGNFEQAIRFQEQHLSIAAQVGDRVAKTLAFSSLGRIHHALGNLDQAVAYLHQGLQIAEQIGRREDEAKIRHRLGLALWGNGDLDDAQMQLYRAADLFESIRRECHGSTDYRLSLFDLQTASYQALQRVLVSLERQEEALVVAERGRTRAFVDLLLERQSSGCTSGPGSRSRVDDPLPSSVDQLLDIINKQKAVVLYYSLAAGYLYLWLIIPNQGVVKFHECCVSDLEVDHPREGIDTNAPVGASLLEQYIQNVREALGVENFSSNTSKTGACEVESESGDTWGQHLEELGDKLNQEGDRSGFLRMVNRSHLFNSSSYSLSSLFSLGSWTGSIASSSVGRQGSARAKKPVWCGPACLRNLYDMLIGPVEDYLPKSGLQKELVVVLEGDLYLVPFSVLRGTNSTDYLCERFDLLVVPSISALKKLPKSKSVTATAKTRGSSEEANPTTTALVVGNPKLSSSITEQWGWDDIPYAEQEASCVAEILGTVPLLGPTATKDTVLRELSQVECIHFATHVSWKLSAIVLAPTECLGSSAATDNLTVAKRLHGMDGDDRSEIASSLDLPSLSEFLLTAADILNLKLSAKLVVVSSCHTRNHHGKAHSDGVVGLARALLAAGAQCVLVSLWPAPDTAVKILLRTFYSSLLQGSRVSRALSEAMQTVQNTKHFAHPANWGGFFLVGSDIKLSSKVALMGQALCELLKTPETCRDALRVVLHLVEKSLQRIHWGQKNAMYTTQKSIENKVGLVSGWKDLLISVGFRFEPAANGIPASVFFPQSDPGERLTQCSASLQALLGISASSLHALSKLLASPEAADDIISLIRQIISQMNMKELDSDGVECPVSVKLWRVQGCHELLASLGFDLMDVGQDEVTLRAGKQASKRHVQFVLQALLAIFDTPEAPSSLGLDDTSSVESVGSCNASDGSESPDISPPPLPSASHFFNTLQLKPPANLVLGSRTGAFSTYVRNRGEPDGRTTLPNETCTPHPPLASIKDRDDKAFTPSPVEKPNLQLSQFNVNSCRFSSTTSQLTINPNIYRSQCPEDSQNSHSSPQPSPRLSLTLSHQTKIRALYPDLTDHFFSEDGEPTMSSVSSLANWENGQSTIVRRQGGQRDRCDASGGLIDDTKNDVPTSDKDCVENMQNCDVGILNALTHQEISVSKTYDSMRNCADNLLMKVPDDPLEKLAVRVEIGKSILKHGRCSPIGNPLFSSSPSAAIAAQIKKFNIGNSASASDRNGAKIKTVPSLPHGQRSNQPLSTLESRLDSSFGRPSRLRKGASGASDSVNRGVHSSTGVYTTVGDNDHEGDYVAEAHGLGPSSIHHRISAAQLSRIERDVAISEVYHDRNVGLDLAPSLSKLLVANGESCDAPPLPPNRSDESRNYLDSYGNGTRNDDALSLAGLSTFIDNLYGSTGSDVGAEVNTVKSSSRQVPPPPKRPPFEQWSTAIPPTPAVRNSKTMHKTPPPPTKPRPKPPSPPPKPRVHALIQEFSSNSSLNRPDLSFQRHQKRDEGDGHSMTESVYGGSGNGASGNSPPLIQDTKLKPVEIPSSSSTFTLHKSIHRKTPHPISKLDSNEKVKETNLADPHLLINKEKGRSTENVVKAVEGETELPKRLPKSSVPWGKVKQPGTALQASKC